MCGGTVTVVEVHWKAIKIVRLLRSAKMSLIKTVVKWILLFLRYILVSVVVGNVMDEFLFHPLEAEIFRFMGSGEESGD